MKAKHRMNNHEKFWLAAIVFIVLVVIIVGVVQRSGVSASIGEPQKEAFSDELLREIIKATWKEISNRQKEGHPVSESFTQHEVYGLLHRCESELLLRGGENYCPQCYLGHTGKPCGYQEEPNDTNYSIDGAWFIEPVDERTHKCPVHGKLGGFDIMAIEIGNESVYEGCVTCVYSYIAKVLKENVPQITKLDEPNDTFVRVGEGAYLDGVAVDPNRQYKGEDFKYPGLDEPDEAEDSYFKLGKRGKNLSVKANESCFQDHFERYLPDANYVPSGMNHPTKGSVEFCTDLATILLEQRVKAIEQRLKALEERPYMYLNPNLDYVDANDVEFWESTFFRRTFDNSSIIEGFQEALTRSYLKGKQE